MKALAEMIVFCIFAPSKMLVTMRRNSIIMLLSMVFVLSATAQQDTTTKPFKAYLFNEEYDVYMRINFHENDVVISWADLFGPLPGFLAKQNGTYCWLVLETEVHDNQAELQIVNDSGSEDLTATLTQENDSIYTLRQKSGSTIKLPQSGKWQKLPRTLTLKRRK